MSGLKTGFEDRQQHYQLVPRPADKVRRTSGAPDPSDSSSFAYSSCLPKGITLVKKWTSGEATSSGEMETPQSQELVLDALYASR